MQETITTQAEVLYEAFLKELESLGHRIWSTEPKMLASGRAVLAAESGVQIAFIRIALQHPARSPRPLISLISLLVRRHLPYTTEDTCAIILYMTVLRSFYDMPVQALLRALARLLLDPTLLATCRPLLEQLRAQVELRWYHCAEQRTFLKLLDEILYGQQEPGLSLRPDVWGEPLLASLAEMDEQQRASWEALLRHCAKASGSVPSKKWQAALPGLLEALGHERFLVLATHWIGSLAMVKGDRLKDDNVVLFKGLAWCCCGQEHAALAAALADAAIEGYRKISGIGPRAPMVAGACINALKTMPALLCAAHLERVRLNTKQASYLKVVEQALNEVAGRANMSRADLEELTVPDFGLEQGRLRRAIGAAYAEIQLVGQGTRIQWFDASGKMRKQVPAEVKRAYKEELKEVQRLSDDIGHMLVAQRDRIERLPLNQRQWDLSVWRERYLKHPLLAHLAQRLIWRFTVAEQIMDAIYCDERLVDAADRPVILPEGARVSLWHPVLSNVAEVEAWRGWLERHQIVQPFKQAHREIYLLTDAERNTRIYSNRFASHILKQHQFNALALVRNWQNQLRLMVDDEYLPAMLPLPRWNLRAEYWIEGIGDNYTTDANEVGTYLRLSTDQVRFYPLDAPLNYAHAGGGSYRASTPATPIPLEEIHPLVFSEVMRDVDLFVGVASVGNDPTWHDGGPEGHYRDYWHTYSFGDLSATAQSRKLLLTQLIPRLAIADRCTFEERYLKVRGTLRTYKIHLGSGNILMEPNDQYLCIVPARAVQGPSTGDLFLPFEGDHHFAIILSKAFLLADDTAITDPTIVRQICR